MTTKTTNLKKARNAQILTLQEENCDLKRDDEHPPSHDNNNGTTIDQIRACLLLRCFLVDLLLGCTQLGYTLDTMRGAEKRFGWWG
jgi:hypothetical protein